MRPRDDKAFRRWLANTIESREVNLNANDLLAVMSFRRALLTLAKRHGLTMTCAVLEGSLYKRKP